LGKAAARFENAFKNADTEEIKNAYPAVQIAFNGFRKEAEEYLAGNIKEN
jgi:hypothetical protein